MIEHRAHDALQHNKGRQQQCVTDLEHDCRAVLLNVDGGPSALKPAAGVVDESGLCRVCQLGLSPRDPA